MVNMVEILKELSIKRPLFHSEADFQHELAWKIHEKYQDINIRLEKREVINDEDTYLDIFCYKAKEIIAIELKYKTNGLDIEINKEKFYLKHQSALDQARYDYIKDISRLENILEKYFHLGTGFAIFLTNCQAYWKKSINEENAVDKEFRIHNERSIKGELKWKEGASSGTMGKREEPIILKDEYTSNWQIYSDLKENSRFMYLLTEIK
jgi:hypothetical protein